MDSQIFGNLRKFINVIDELRDVGLQQYINLPRICVVGTQSAGKSSVLESIVGLEFLPRGEGIVTRRPLELRLVHLTDGKENAPYACFEIGPNQKKKFHDFSEVKAYISHLTDQVAGKNKGLSNKPIILTVYSRECPDLTLIDLPGITRVPLKGSDQNDDVERLTRDMTLSYACDERTIILAVMSANVDMTTADALQIARRVDPTGVRTIGVITKVDLMDKGTNVLSMVQGDVVPLRLGYVAVRNRGQQDILDNKNVKEALKEEEEFFNTHPIYKHLTKTYFGTETLIEKLTKVLFRHIRTYLPEIKKEINLKLREVSEKLEKLGEGVPDDISARNQLIWQMTTDYCDLFKNSIRGKYDKRLRLYDDHNENTLSGGAKIRYIFNELLSDYVNVSCSDGMSDADIEHAIFIHEGDNLPGFPSPDTFEFLILPHLKKLHYPVMDCLDKVMECLETLSQKTANRVFERFPLLAEQTLMLSDEIILKQKERTKSIIEKIMLAQTGYLFTNDEQYLSSHAAMLPLHEKGTPPPQESKKITSLSGMQQKAAGIWASVQGNNSTRYSSNFIKEIRSRVDAYFALVLKNVRDTIPKTIGYFLVRQLQDRLQFELYQNFTKTDNFTNMLGEGDSIKEERIALRKQLAILKKSANVLQKDLDIAGLRSDDFEINIPPPPIIEKPIVQQNSQTKAEEIIKHAQQNIMKSRANKPDEKISLFDQKRNVHDPLFG